MLDSQIVAQVRAIVNNVEADLELNAREVTTFYSEGLIKGVKAYRERLQEAHRKHQSVYVPSLSECKKLFDALPASRDKESEDLKNLLAGKYHLVTLPVWRVKELVAGGPMEDAFLAYLYRKGI